MLAASKHTHTSALALSIHESEVDSNNLFEAENEPDHLSYYTTMVWKWYSVRLYPGKGFLLARVRSLNKPYLAVLLEASLYAGRPSHIVISPLLFSFLRNNKNCSILVVHYPLSPQLRN